MQSEPAPSRGCVTAFRHFKDRDCSVAAVRFICQAVEPACWLRQLNSGFIRFPIPTHRESLNQTAKFVAVIGRELNVHAYQSGVGLAVTRRSHIVLISNNLRSPGRFGWENHTEKRADYRAAPLITRIPARSRVGRA